MRKQKRIWAYLLSAAMVVTSFTMSGTTGKAEGTTEKGKIVSVTDRTSTKKAASVTENGKVASVTKKVSTSMIANASKAIRGCPVPIRQKMAKMKAATSMTVLKTPLKSFIFFSNPCG